jgi:hypothetical protein
MRLDIVLLMLGAALLHAAWNAIIKGGSNPLFEAALKTLGGGPAVCRKLPFLPLPAAGSAPYLATSQAGDAPEGRKFYGHGMNVRSRMAKIHTLW